jgi:hypothetical protein
MPKLHLSAAQLRYLRRLVAEDDLVLHEALRRLHTGERIGVVPPRAQAVIAQDAELATELLEKIDQAL